MHTISLCDIALNLLQGLAAVQLDYPMALPRGAGECQAAEPLPQVQHTSGQESRPDAKARRGEKKAKVFPEEVYRGGSAQQAVHLSCSLLTDKPPENPAVNLCPRDGFPFSAQHLPPGSGCSFVRLPSRRYYVHLCVCERETMWWWGERDGDLVSGEMSRCLSRHLAPACNFRGVCCWHCRA